ncbi:MarR family winged helix-turn-helix transcriptional regulator [Amnibacterium flavum]|uniref:HTH marR-type domain-containing protein n=1 Tax=Amnibacterium flavum TaxID=2173173 RepID=A0A2V1HM06_9MICO|nr:hypothetical protein [Amnibacterium flavum]PVZ93666.1 hypothetical protein DDQ50_07615 [Amnibacterium flavum]
MITPHGEPDEDPVESTLRASRALLGVVARSSIDALTRVSVSELRLLVLLTSRGPSSPSELAARMGEGPASVDPLLSSLASRAFVAFVSGADPASPSLQITSRGREIVDEVTERRRSELATILARLSHVQRRELGEALSAFADAADEASSEELLILGL